MSSKRILVAVDASPHSLAALRAAVGLAARLGQELDALYVEDVNLLRLAGLPFCREVGSYTASVRLLDSRTIEQTFRRLAADIQRSIDLVARPSHVSWSFRVVRGGVSDEVTAAAHSASLVSLGRVGHSPGQRIGSTTQMLLTRLECPLLIVGADGQVRPPFTVLFSSAPSSARALRLAISLAHRNGDQLHVLISPEDADSEKLEQTVTNDLTGVTDAHVSLVDTPGKLAETLQSLNGVLILPAEQVSWLTRVEMAVIVVP
jgi:nucleotide-binding universal stress UspA family protein